MKLANLAFQSARSIVFAGNMLCLFPAFNHLKSMLYDIHPAIVSAGIIFATLQTVLPPFF